MPGVARVGDICKGRCRGHKKRPHKTGTIATGSGKIECDGRMVARVGDTVIASCGHTGTIVSGSNRVTADGRGVARVGDRFEGTFYGIIITGSPKTTD